MKRLLLACILGLVMVSGPAWADDEENAACVLDNGSGAPLHADSTPPGVNPNGCNAAGFGSTAGLAGLLALGVPVVLRRRRP